MFSVVDDRILNLAMMVRSSEFGQAKGELRLG
jgi:hypothetical protein